MKFEIESARIANRLAFVVATPEGGGNCITVGAFCAGTL